MENENDGKVRMLELAKSTSLTEAVTAHVENVEAESKMTGEGGEDEHTTSGPKPQKKDGGKVEKKGSSATAFILKKSVGQGTNPVRKPALVVLTERLLTGQYVRLEKLSRRRIEDSLGCSVTDYLRVEGRMTLTEALRSPEYRGVQLTAREKEEVSLVRDRDPPQPLPLPPQSPKLSCVFCQEEFDDFDSRVGHYSLHISGQIVRPSPLPAFPCPLCEAQCDSVQHRRDHYQLVHCSPQISNNLQR